VVKSWQRRRLERRDGLQLRDGDREYYRVSVGNPATARASVGHITLETLSGRRYGG
jgi:hypothetical protein